MSGSELEKELKAKLKLDLEAEPEMQELDKHARGDTPPMLNTGEPEKQKKSIKLDELTEGSTRA